MTNRLLGILLLFAALPLMAQERFVPVDWLNMPDTERLPSVVENIPLPDDYRSYTYHTAIEFPELSAISDKDRAGLKFAADTLPPSPLLRTAISISAHKPYLTVSFTPMVCRNGVVSRINSYKLSINRERSSVAVDATRATATSSVLASGRFVRVRVSGNGVYSISNQELRSMGFNTPELVHMYGYGGRLIPENFSEQPADDLPEVPLLRRSDGVLFYARGTLGWQWDGTKFTRVRNCYSDYAYYFLTESDTQGSFPVEEATPQVEAHRITTSDEHTLYERDEYSWSSTGRELYEEYNYTSGNTCGYKLDTEGATGTSAMVTVSFAAMSSTSSSSVTVEADNVKAGTLTIAPTGGDYDIKAMETTSSFSLSGEIGDETEIKLTHNRASGISGRLNYIAINYKRRLTLSAPYLEFRSVEALSQASTFSIAGATSTTVVWDVTDPSDYKEMRGELTDGVYSFSIGPSDKVREFVALDTNATFGKVDNVTEIEAQDLHSMPATEMVVIVPDRKSLAEQAERLAQAHRDRDGMSVRVVTAQQVYNEFSSGTPDATAYRRLMKMLYDRYTDEDSRPKYLLLFGDCAYDNRMVTTAWSTYKPSDFLLSYQVAVSNNDKYSYLTDDYFGFLDDDEGGSLGNDRLDIGIGRLPVRSDTEAKAMVDKIIEYMDNTAAGSWKRTVTFVADDAEGDKSDNSFMLHAIELADSLKSYNPFYKAERILADAYKREASSTGYSYPEVNRRLSQLFDNGMLMLNYTGHSSTTAWAEENLITTDEISKLTSKRLPLWFTASCEFGRFDGVDDSGGEMALLNANGGAIAVVSSSRIVYDAPNFNLHKAVIRTIFGNGRSGKLRLGDMIREAKQADNTLLSDGNKLNFNLLGDPALALALPELGISVTEIAGMSTDSIAPTIKAGEKVRVRGVVTTEDGQVADDFNGVMNALVLDSEESVSTLDNAGKGAVSYSDNLRTIFSGSDSIRSGRFDFTIPVPLDINYSGKSGMMRLYALATDKREAAGAFDGFNVGGTADDIADDNDGPTVSIYLNTPDFAWGETTNETPFFVAEIEDASGINTSGNGIGHDLTLTIDGKTSYTLNDYYTSEQGDYTRGRVAFSIPELQDGEHSLRFRAWDVMNNSTTKTLDFKVAHGTRPAITSLTSSISPARSYTTFILAHNRPMSGISVTITVRDMTGRTVWKMHEQSNTSDAYYRADWDLTDTNGRRVEPGIYLFSAEIASTESKQSTKTEKLVVLAQ